MANKGRRLDANKGRRLDDLKLDVHDLTEIIERIEEGPDTKTNRTRIEFARIVREGIKQEIHCREMKARKAVA